MNEVHERYARTAQIFQSVGKQLQEDFEGFSKRTASLIEGLKMTEEVPGRGYDRRHTDPVGERLQELTERITRLENRVTELENDLSMIGPIREGRFDSDV